MAGGLHKSEFKNSVINWIDSRLPIFTLMNNAVGTKYPAPKNLNFLWSFGALAGLFLVIQILTGIVLAMHYVPNAELAFGSVQHIIRDVDYGWLLQSLHANGASFFFIVVYIHIFRGLYFGSYKAPRELLWMLGVVIFLLMMATAFMGYVLPWGQMSFWGATVITNILGAIPLVGEPIRELLWGGFAVDNPTLNRFYSLHYLLPFVIVGVVILHIWALHLPGSNNPLGIDVKSNKDQVAFHPYYTIKDIVGVGIALFIFSAVVFFAPDYLGHPDNYIQADPLKTPEHIVPEWYFLPFYAILRAITYDFLGIDAKLWGVIAMFASIFILFLLPWLDTSKVRSATFRPIYKQVYWLLVIDVIILTIVGGRPAEGIWVLLGQISTSYYFLHFLILLPLIGWLETPKPLPESIDKASAHPVEG